MVQRQPYLSLTAFLLLQALPGTFAHGDAASNSSAHMAMDMGHNHKLAGVPGVDRPMVMKDMEDFPDHATYFLHDEHSALMLAHIGLMVVGWVIVLPLTVMLGIGRSGLLIPSQLLFLLLNALGVLLSMIYYAQVPDLYPKNIHHGFGWVVTILATVWTILGLVDLYARPASHETSMSNQPLSQQAIAEYQRLNGSGEEQEQRRSHESAHHTEDATNTLCNSSRANSWNTESDAFSARQKHAYFEDEDTDEEKLGFIRGNEVDRFMSRHVSGLTAQVARIIHSVYVVLERGMIPLSFVALVTGIVTYSGIGMGGHIFNVLAHLVKGGIFFGYGLLTFGRWMGCYSDLGWAWNVKPGADMVGRKKARIPSAEFVESFVIFFYGATNVFMEHMGAWGKKWTAMDFEHVSITIMFFGGGLLGMLIESCRVRSLLSANTTNATDASPLSPIAWTTPRSYIHSLNPIPSLVILLLGIMMSNHTQHSLISGQIHRQWGLLFAGFALARSITYVTLWLKPPTSYAPSRPPTELLASFCLVSGGAIFMASNKDTINALEEYDLDSMFVFTVMMGFTCLIMAWELSVVAVKGWAERRQMRDLPSKSLDSPPSPASPA